MKANFKVSNDGTDKKIQDEPKDDSDISEKELEEFVLKSGAKGSFMVFRSDNKDEELGIDEL